VLSIIIKLKADVSSLNQVTSALIIMVTISGI